MEMPTALSLLETPDQILQADPQLLGKVAGQYQTLLKHHFPLPTGFIITSHVFTAAATKEVYELLGELYAEKQNQPTMDWNELSKASQTLVANLNVPDEVWLQIVAAYHRIFHNQPVIVRVSIGGEDVGYYPSYHDVHGDANLMDSLKQLWRGCFSLDHIQQRYAEWQRHEPFLCSLLVQHQLTAASSGIVVYPDHKQQNKNLARVYATHGAWKMSFQTAPSADEVLINIRTNEVIEHQPAPKPNNPTLLKILQKQPTHDWVNTPQSPLFQQLVQLTLELRQQLYPAQAFEWLVDSGHRLAIIQVFDVERYEWLNK
jgi:phosphoenolpyruvate synthase/pyruvate phosphate dikinase